MAGGTGVAQITSPGQSMPGMAPISAVAQRGQNVPSWMINNPNFDPMAASQSGMQEYTNPATGETYMGSTSSNNQYMLDPSLKGNFTTPNRSFSLGPGNISQGGNSQFNSQFLPKNGFGDTFGSTPLQANSVTNIPDAGTPDWIKAMGGTLADGDISADMQGQGQQGPLQVSNFEPLPMPGGNRSFSYGPDGQMQQGMQRIPQQNPNLFDNSSRPSSMNNLGAGKGGGGGQPAMPTARPPQGQYAPMAPQGQFNVNQASAGALQQALGTTQQAMQGPINIGAYANPYENQVVQQSMRDVGSAAQMGVNQLDAQAGAAKAFGGSRHGIAQAETMKGFNQQAMDQAAQLRSQGFNTSLQAAMADRQARLGAASQLGGLGQQAFQTGQAIQGQQQQQGLLQQSIQQALIDAARQQYAGYTGAPNTALQAPLAALGIAQQGGASTTTTSDQPGLLSYLQAASGFVKPR